MFRKQLRSAFTILTVPNDFYATDILKRFFYEEVSRNNVEAALMRQINKTREGESSPDGETVSKKVVCVLQDLGMRFYYYFQSAVFKNANTYYSRMSDSWIRECSCVDYLLKVVGCLRVERETIAVKWPVHRNSQNRFVKTVENELLCKHTSRLLDCLSLLRNETMDDLSKVLKLYSGIERGIQLMANMFRRHVTQMAAETVKSSNQIQATASENHQFVKTIYLLRQKYSQFVKKFTNHFLSRNALTEAFQSLCNEQVAGYSIWKLLVAVCDSILRNRSMAAADVEDSLHVVAELFPYVYTEDTIDQIAESYMKKLNDRLLNRKSLHFDYEKSILDKLKLKGMYGRRFTFKMQGMLNDWVLSMKTQSAYEEYLRQNHPHPCSGIEFSVTVLSSGFWPRYGSPESLVLPDEMARHLESFKEFYKIEKRNRRLTWNHNLGTCLMSGRFEQGEIQIVGTPCHASALLLFNETERLSFSQVKSQLNLKVEDTTELLKSLACSKYKILTKLPDTQSVTETDYFEVNATFSCSNKRKIRLPARTSNVKENVGKAVIQDAHYIIDASIVRIMKKRKAVLHTELLMECAEQVKDWIKPDEKKNKNED